MENAKLQQQKKNHLIKSYLFCMGMQDIPWGPKRYLRFVGRSWKAQNFEKTYFNESYGFCHGHGNSYLEVQKSVWGWPVGHIKHKITKKKKNHFEKHYGFTWACKNMFWDLEKCLRLGGQLWKVQNYI